MKRSPGRPTHAPKEENLQRLYCLAHISHDLEKILKKCGMPSHWGLAEFCLIMGFFMNPQRLNAASDKKRPVERTADALLWGKMFSEAPRAMVTALPKIRARILKMRRSPIEAVIFDYARTRDTCKFGLNCDAEYFIKHDPFFKLKATDLADVFGKKLRLPVSAKVIDNARKRIVRLLKYSPKAG